MDWLTGSIDDIQKYIVLVTAVAGILAVVAGKYLTNLFLKFIRIPFVAAWNFLNKTELKQNISDIAVQLCKITDKLEEMHDRINENNDASIAVEEAVIQLKARQEQLVVKIKAILEQPAFSPSFETDDHGNFLWVSASFSKLVGRSSQEILGWGWTNIIEESESERVRDSWELAIKENRVFEMRFNINTINGVSNVYCRAEPAHLRGNGHGWFGFFNIIK